MVSSAQGPPFDGSRQRDQHHQQQHSDAHSSHQISSSAMDAQKQNFLAQLIKSHDYDQGEVFLRNTSLKRHVLSKEALEFAFSEVANDADNSSNNDRIRKVYFMAYNFPTLPGTPIIGATYINLRHVDIRDNDEFNDIGPILRQIPNLTSLNVSDCPSLTSLLPIATVPMETRRNLALKHLWVRGTSLADMTVGEWKGVFRAFAQSSGPMERLALCRNQLANLPCSIVLLCSSLTYLFVEDMPDIVIPEVIGSMKRLRYLSLAGNDLKRLPKTIGRLGNHGVGGGIFSINLHRNPNLISPPAEYQHSIETIRVYLHTERMCLLRGLIRLYPHMRRARLRANERMYRPNGSGYWSSKERFERRQSSQQLDEEIENGLG